MLWAGVLLQKKEVEVGKFSLHPATPSFTNGSPEEELEQEDRIRIERRKFN